MPLESLSSFSSTGTVSGTNTVNNTQKINTVAIGTGDITIDATKIPFSTSDNTNVNAKITSVDTSTVHKDTNETVTGTKTFTSLTKFSNGISIVNNDDTTYEIRNGGNNKNELIIIMNGKQSDDNTIFLVTDNLVKIGSAEHSRVILGYTVEDTSNSNEVATTKWVNTYAAVPAGTVITYAGTKTPSGYLLCDGSAVSRTTYSKLFNAIGTTYGTGDGSTTFNLPKIIDNRFIEYVSASDTIGKLKDAGLPNITGKFFGPRVSNLPAPEGAFDVESTGSTYAASDDSGSMSNNFVFDASKSNVIYGNSTTVQPKSITLRAYIKY